MSSEESPERDQEPNVIRVCDVKGKCSRCSEDSSACQGLMGNKRYDVWSSSAPSVLSESHGGVTPSSVLSWPLPDSLSLSLLHAPSVFL